MSGERRCKQRVYLSPPDVFSLKKTKKPSCKTVLPNYRKAVVLQNSRLLQIKSGKVGRKNPNATYCCMTFKGFHAIISVKGGIV